MINFSLKKYGKKERFLGEGVTGHVDLYIKSNSERYAIKTYNGKEKYETTKEYYLRTSREYEIVKDLKNAHVVQVFEFIHMKRLKLVMLYYPVQLRDVAKTNDRYRYFRQLIFGMKYLHSNGVCHRDIKLDSLLVDINDNLRIIDFGDAVKGKKECIGVVGTGLYVAPEVHAKFRYDPYKSDMWSVGVVLYFLRTGVLPWKLLKLHEDQKYKFFIEDGENGLFGDGENNEVDEVILKLLEVDTDKRLNIYQLETEFNRINV